MRRSWHAWPSTLDERRRPLPTREVHLVLTPAEELGLSGLGLASRVRKAFYTMPEPEVIALIERIREEAFRRHLVYLRDGQAEAIRVLPCPVTVLPDQLAYVQFV